MIYSHSRTEVKEQGMNALIFTPQEINIIRNINIHLKIPCRIMPTKLIPCHAIIKRHKKRRK
jgi:hypothetical protein